MAATHLTTGSSTSNVASFATASISPSANRLVLVGVMPAGGSGTTPTPTVSGNGLTWTLVAQTGGTTRNVYVYRAMTGGTAPTPGALTLDMGGTALVGCAWTVIEYDGVDTSGTNGSGAIAQSFDVNPTGVNPFSADFPTAPDPANAGFAFVGYGLNEAATAGTGWTGQATNYATPNLGAISLRANSCPATVAVNFSTTTNTWGVGVEVKAAAGGTNYTPSAADTAAATDAASTVTAESAAAADTAAATDAATAVLTHVGAAADTAAATDAAATALARAVTVTDTAAGTDAATAVLAPPAASLVDTFDAQSAEFTGYTADVFLSGGALNIQPRTSYPRLESTKVYTLRGSTFTGELLQLATTSGTSASTSLVFRIDATNFIELSISPTSANPIGARFTTAGVASDVYFAAVAGATHYRIEVTTGGQILWRAYASGAWTTIRTATLPAAWGEVIGTERILAGYFTGAETSGQAARWGSVNVEPAGVAYTPSATDTAGAVDSATTAVAAQQAAADVAAATDAVTTVAADAAAVADVAGAVDTVTSARSVSATPADTAAATDAVTFSRTTAVAATDTAGAVDAATSAEASARTVADTAGITDAAAVTATPLMETLVDPFTSQNNTLWTYPGSNVTVDTGTGELVITPTTAYPRIASAIPYNIQGSYLTAEFTQLPTAAVGSSPGLSIKVIIDASNSIELAVGETGAITCRYTSAGVASDLQYERQVGATHYRIRVTSDRLINFEAFAYGDWRPLRRNVAAPAGWDLNAVTAQVLAGYWNAADSGITQARVGSVGILPAVTDNRKLKFGAAVGGTITPSTIVSLTTAAGRSPAVELIFRAWSLPINTALLQQIHDRGALPVYTWEAWDYTGPTNAPYALARIVAGDFDAYITTSAQQIKALGFPIVLRPFHEFNGNSYPWSIGQNGNTAADLIAAWRRVWDIFAAEGVTNVRWFWCPNIRVAAGSVAVGYPGDAYVDIVGVDAYNAGGGSWTPAWALFNNTFNEIRTVATGKLMWIGETSSAETGGDKAAWWNANGPYPSDKGFFRWARGVSDLAVFEIFHINKEENWQIDSTEASRAAFAAELALLAPDSEQTDLAAITDAITTARGIAAADSAGAVDTVTASMSFQLNAVAADSAGAVDAATVTEAAARTAADTAAAVDAASTADALDRSTADAAGVTDATATSTAAARTAGDTAAVTDNVTADIGVLGTAADTAAATDAASYSLGRATTAADTAAATDAVTWQMTRVVILADTAGAVDAAGRAVTALRTAADSAAAVDAVSTARVFTVADVAGAVDAATAVLTAFAGAFDVRWGRVRTGGVGGRVRTAEVAGKIRDKGTSGTIGGQ